MWSNDLETFLKENQIESFILVDGEVVRQVRAATPAEVKSMVFEILRLHNVREYARLERYLDTQGNMGDENPMVLKDTTDGD